MDTIQFGRLIVIPFPIIFTIFFIPLLKKQRNGKTVVYKLLLSSIFLAIAGCSALFVPIILWVHLVGIAAMHYWVFCVYLATDHIINNKRYIPVLKNPAFIIVTGLTSANLVLDFLRQPYLTPFIDYDPPIRTWLYFASELIHYLTMTYICAISLRLYFVRFHQPSSNMYSIRFVSGFMAFMLGFVGTGLINIGIFAVWAFPGIDRTIFTEFYHVSKLGVMIASTFGFALPPRWLTWVFYPLYYYQKRSSHKEQIALSWLHHLITTIVPGVKLEDTRILSEDPDRYIIEITEGLEVILSHNPGHQMGNIMKDIRFLKKLYEDQVIYRTYGIHHAVTPDDRYIELLSKASMLQSQEWSARSPGARGAPAGS